MVTSAMAARRAVNAPFPALVEREPATCRHDEINNQGV